MIYVEIIEGIINYLPHYPWDAHSYERYWARYALSLWTFSPKKITEKFIASSLEQTQLLQISSLETKKKTFPCFGNLRSNIQTFYGILAQRFQLPVYVTVKVYSQSGRYI
jgi:hypothetical protein